VAAYVHVYTGNGKGKTTAAFGVAIRTGLMGRRVYIGQFLKGMKYSETKISDLMENIEIEQLGRSCLIDCKPTKEDYECAKDGLEKALDSVSSGKYSLVILDEITIAVYLGLIKEEDLIKIIDKRHGDTELIITGRYASEKIIDFADLVTEMKEIKHYYQKGVMSREGIDC
jgi:cob(I)alamin adenosyltransferase